MLTAPDQAVTLGGMVWRIHFTAQDLARTRIGPPIGPLAETQLALSMLRFPVQRPAGFGAWRRHAQGLRTAQIKPLDAMVRPGCSGVDLYAATIAAPTAEKGAEALLAMPCQALAAELEYADRRSRLPGPVWAVAEQGSAGRLQLAAAAQAAYQTLIEPYWTRISAQLHAERSARGRILMDGGVQLLLATLQPGRIRWRPPVLEVDICADADLYLDGRGVMLIPSLFAGDTPVLLLPDETDATAACKLIFAAAPADPAIHRQLWSGRRGTARPLAALVGRTRAEALHSIADSCTTTELAHRARISAAAASQHATVLREAGLITTRRHGSSVLHTLTPLGAQLLDRSKGPGPPA